MFQKPSDLITVDHSFSVPDPAKQVSCHSQTGRISESWFDSQGSFCLEPPPKFRNPPAHCPILLLALAMLGPSQYRHTWPHPSKSKTGKTSQKPLRAFLPVHLVIPELKNSPGEARAEPGPLERTASRNSGRCTRSWCHGSWKQVPPY